MILDIHFRGRNNEAIIFLPTGYSLLFKMYFKMILDIHFRGRNNEAIIFSPTGYSLQGLFAIDVPTFNGL